MNKQEAKHAFEYYTADKAPLHRLTVVIVMSILLLLLYDTTIYLCCCEWESIRVHVYEKYNMIAPMHLTTLRMMMVERNGGEGSIHMEQKTR